MLKLTVLSAGTATAALVIHCFSENSPPHEKTGYSQKYGLVKVFRFWL